MFSVDEVEGVPLADLHNVHNNFTVKNNIGHVTRTDLKSQLPAVCDLARIVVFLNILQNGECCRRRFVRFPSSVVRKLSLQMGVCNGNVA